jgi:hypothetical protein
LADAIKALSKCRLDFDVVDYEQIQPVGRPQNLEVGHVNRPRRLDICKGLEIRRAPGEFIRVIEQIVVAQIKSRRRQGRGFPAAARTKAAGPSAEGPLRKNE